MKWNPGRFSAPHSYATDRIQMVLSGTWWVNSGADFTPQQAVPVPAGGYVKRTARTFHYDGVPRDIAEPVTVAVFGEGPVRYPLGRSVSAVLAPGLAAHPSADSHSRSVISQLQTFAAAVCLCPRSAPWRSLC